MAKRSNKKQKVNFGQVVQALQDPNQDVPATYLYKLSDIGPGDLPGLKLAWPKIRPERRIALIEDLLMFSESDETLDFSQVGLLAIADVNAKVRELGVRLLAPYEPVELISEFIRLAESDPEVEVRAVAAAALGVYVFLGEIEEIDPEELAPIEAVLRRVTAEGQPDLVRRRGLEALSYSSDESVMQMIKDAYAKNSIDWTVTALNAMSRNLSETWNPIVLSSLHDDRPAVRAEAAHAAGEMELDEARQPLLDMLTDDDEDAQAAAIWSLSQIGGEGVGEALTQLLDQTEDEDLGAFIEEALENLEMTEGDSILDLIDLSELGEDDGFFDEDSYLSDFSPNGSKPN